MKTGTEKVFLNAIIGLIAGVVATGPMTVAMILWHRRLPHRERYPLPPREITMELARETGLAEEMSSEARSAATLLAHFGYGGAAGAIYGAINDEIPAHPGRKGVGFGLLVWMISYLGLIPGAGVLSIATRHPARRNLLMIGAHIIWGAALGLLTGILQDEANRMDQQPFSDPAAPHKDRSITAAAKC